MLCKQQIQHGIGNLEKIKDLKDRSRRNNLPILGIKKDPRELWEECENKIYDLLEEKLEIGRSNICIDFILLHILVIMFMKI